MEENNEVFDDSNDPFEGIGLRITFNTEDGSFLKIKETLTRIGLYSKSEGKQTLIQSCHILHKRGEYAIVHFKEMFSLDHRNSTFACQDEARRDAIALLLQEWGLLKLLDQPASEEAERKAAKFKVIPYKDKSNWVLRSKYTFSQRKHNDVD